MNRIPPARTAFLILLLIAAAPLRAQIHADVATSEGTFTMELDYVNSPLAVGNFIGLVTGTKAWVDASSGVVRTNTPYYPGIIFHRVIAGFMNQTGSQGGEGKDGPGYNFLDEFSTSDFSDPYTVAMANSGPQSNGAQFFITVAPTTHLDGVHTVFGTVPEDDGPDGIVDGSRDVIDAINAVPVDDSTPIDDVVIHSITIRRIGAPAMAFDEAAQALPVVAATDIEISFPGPDTKPILLLDQAPGTTFQIGLSGDLDEWTLDERYLDASADAPLTEYNPVPLQTRFDRHFFSPALTTWPADALFPDSLAGRVLTALTEADPIIPFTFTFDASGEAGDWIYPRVTEPLSGTFTLTFFLPDGYGCRLVLNLSGINLNRWDFRRVGLDSSDPGHLSGRHVGVATDTFSGGSLPIDGTFTLTR